MVTKEKHLDCTLPSSIVSANWENALKQDAFKKGVTQSTIALLLIRNLRIFLNMTKCFLFSFASNTPFLFQNVSKTDEKKKEKRKIKPKCRLQQIQYITLSLSVLCPLKGHTYLSKPVNTKKELQRSALLAEKHIF